MARPAQWRNRVFDAGAAREYNAADRETHDPRFRTPESGPNGVAVSIARAKDPKGPAYIRPGETSMPIDAHASLTALGVVAILTISWFRVGGPI